MASRFGRNDARNALFSNYDAQTRSRPSSSSASPAPGSASGSASGSGSNNRNPPYAASSSSPYGLGANDSSSGLNAYGPQGGGGGGGPAFSAYPGAEGGGGGGRLSGEMSGRFRPATPNTKGQYSDSVLSEMEAQSEEQAGEMSKKVKMLKDLTMAIGDEIRDSTAFAEKMNDSFEGTRNRLRGTMNRMLRMAERTGVGWRIWLGFFVFIWLLFAYVWLF